MQFDCNNRSFLELEKPLWAEPWYLGAYLGVSAFQGDYRNMERTLFPENPAKFGTCTGSRYQALFPPPALILISTCMGMRLMLHVRKAQATECTAS